MKAPDAAALLQQKLAALKDDRGQLAALAKATGVTPATVTEWVKGRYSPGLDKLGPISAFLKIRVSDLFDGQPIITNDSVTDSPTEVPGDPVNKSVRASGDRVKLLPSLRRSEGSYVASPHARVLEHQHAALLTALRHIAHTATAAIGVATEAASDSATLAQHRPPPTHRPDTPGRTGRGRSGSAR